MTLLPVPSRPCPEPNPGFTTLGCNIREVSFVVVQHELSLTVSDSKPSENHEQLAPNTQPLGGTQPSCEIPQTYLLAGLTERKQWRGQQGINTGEHRDWGRMFLWMGNLI